MDVDEQFPNLSLFVRPKTRQYLNLYGVRAKPKDGEYWSLASSCWAVQTEQMTWRDGPHQTLKTLDEFIRCLPPNTPKRAIRDKICNPNGSGFLDMVVEASWALHFWARNIDVNLEQPLDPSKPRGKNADIVVNLDGIKYWLDVKSIKLRAYPKITSR